MEQGRISLKKWLDFWKYYKEMPHQSKALEFLYEAMPLSLLDESAHWIDLYRSGTKEVECSGSTINNAGLQLIKEFEGLRLEAYLCPAGVWSIGYGDTHNVAPGDKITEAEAEERLRKHLVRFEKAVKQLVKVSLNEYEFSALVSFTYNVGEGALEISTLLRRLNAGEDKATVFSEELPKWVYAGDRKLPGLVRRRNAEIALALS